MLLKEAVSKDQYQREAKEYVINMIRNKRTLHKKNTCFYSHMLCAYYDFDTLEDAERSGIPFSYCKKCFK